MFGWTSQGTKRENLRIKLLQDVVKTQVELRRVLGTIEKRVSELEVRQRATESGLQLAKDCMNRVTELALVASGRDELAERFRAQSVAQERESELSWEEDEDEWPPSDSCVMTVG
jgi:hypothetical protein